MDEPNAVDRLLAEQRSYYREIAPHYESYAIPGAWGDSLLGALERFSPRGDVLELACGTGLWTEQLVRTARSVTAVDASEEMIAIAARRVVGHDVRFIHGDIFTWVPPRRFDVVLFGFWLSHVPTARFADFWAVVDRALADDGRVFFADDAHRTPEELVFGAESEVVQRRLHTGGVHRVVKVPHTAESLESRLAALGWRIAVTQTDGPFFWGEGGRA